MRVTEHIVTVLDERPGRQVAGGAGSGTGQNRMINGELNLFSPYFPNIFS
jgi:hypothetical protein